MIPSRFRGPPRSGNGGYVCGALARRLTAMADSGAPAVPQPAITVNLRSPPPLDAPMALVETASASGPGGHQGLRMVLGETLVAAAEPAEPGLLDGPAMALPEAPSFDAAAAAVAASPAFWPRVNSLVPGGLGVHPICACCGADVTADQGLRVFAAPVPGFAGVTAAWTPDAAFDDGRGLLPAELIWTALDCPGQFAWLEQAEDGSVINNALLGRFTVRIDAPVAIGEPCRVLGWRIDPPEPAPGRAEGGAPSRKFEAGTALIGADGTLRAIGRALWIRFDPARFASP